MNFQEDSLRMGFAYIVAVISLFDEYANDLLYLTEGSCFPRYSLGLRYKVVGIDEENSPFLNLICFCCLILD